MTTLYRADSGTAPYFGQRSCWSETLEAAEAYTDNQGFGGPVIYQADIKAQHVLDLVGDSGPIQTLAELLHDDIEEAAETASGWSMDYGYVYRVWESEPEVFEALRQRYDWIRYEDDFPDGAVTWVYLETPALKAERV